MKVELKINEGKKVVIDVPKGTSNKVVKNELDKIYQHTTSKQSSWISYECEDYAFAYQFHLGVGRI